MRGMNDAMFVLLRIEVTNPRCLMIDPDNYAPIL